MGKFLDAIERLSDKEIFHILIGEKHTINIKGEKNFFLYCECPFCMAVKRAVTIVASIRFHNRAIEDGATAFDYEEDETPSFHDPKFIPYVALHTEILSSLLKNKEDIRFDTYERFPALLSFRFYWDKTSNRQQFIYRPYANDQLSHTVRTFFFTIGVKITDYVKEGVVRDAIDEANAHHIISNVERIRDYFQGRIEEEDTPEDEGETIEDAIDKANIDQFISTVEDARDYLQKILEREVEEKDEVEEDEEEDNSYELTVKETRQVRKLLEIFAAMVNDDED